MTSDDKLCLALAKAKHMSPEIVALLHSAYYDGYHLPNGMVSDRIRDARQYAEKLLLAIGEAELAVSPAAPAAPANAPLEPFPGNGAFTA